MESGEEAVATIAESVRLCMTEKETSYHQAKVANRPTSPNKGRNGTHGSNLQKLLVESGLRVSVACHGNGGAKNGGSFGVGENAPLETGEEQKKSFAIISSEEISSLRKDLAKAKSEIQSKNLEIQKLNAVVKQYKVGLKASLQREERIGSGSRSGSIPSSPVSSPRHNHTTAAFAGSGGDFSNMAVLECLTRTTTSPHPPVAPDDITKTYLSKFSVVRPLTLQHTQRELLVLQQHNLALQEQLDQALEHSEQLQARLDTERQRRDEVVDGVRKRMADQAVAQSKLLQAEVEIGRLKKDIEFLKRKHEYTPPPNFARKEKLLDRSTSITSCDNSPLADPGSSRHGTVTKRGTKETRIRRRSDSSPSAVSNATYRGKGKVAEWRTRVGVGVGSSRTAESSSSGSSPASPFVRAQKKLAPEIQKTYEQTTAKMTSSQHEPLPDSASPDSEGNGTNHHHSPLHSHLVSSSNRVDTWAWLKREGSHSSLASSHSTSDPTDTWCLPPAVERYTANTNLGGRDGGKGETPTGAENGNGRDVRASCGVSPARAKEQEESLSSKEISTLRSFLKLMSPDIPHG